MRERSIADLQRLSDHVLYEAQMLFAVADRLRELHRGDYALRWEVRMALIESFTVHARVLIEFLWHEPKPGGKRRFEDDGFAADYFDTGQWQELRRSKEPAIEDVWKRAGAEIAHMSYNRSNEPDEREWRFDQIAASIGRAFRLFLANVDGGRLVDGFEDRLRRTWPSYLNHPVAVSYPPTQGTPAVATTALRNVDSRSQTPDVHFLPPGGSLGGPVPEE